MPNVRLLKELQNDLHSLVASDVYKKGSPKFKTLVGTMWREFQTSDAPKLIELDTQPKAYADLPFASVTQPSQLGRILTPHRFAGEQYPGVQNVWQQMPRPAGAVRAFGGLLFNNKPDTFSEIGARVKEGFLDPSTTKAPSQVIEEQFPTQYVAEGYDQMPMVSFTQPSKVGAGALEMFKTGVGGISDFVTDPVAQAAWQSGTKVLGGLGKAALGSKLGQKYLAPIWEALQVQRGPFAAKPPVAELLPPTQRLNAPIKARPRTTIDITPKPTQIGYEPSIVGKGGEGFVFGTGSAAKSAKFGKKFARPKGKPLRPTPPEARVPGTPVEPQAIVEIPTRKFPRKVPTPTQKALPPPSQRAMKPGEVRMGEGFTVSEPLPKVTPLKKPAPSIFKKKSADITKPAPKIVPKRGSQGRVFKKEPISTYVKPKTETTLVNGEEVKIVPAGKVWKFKFRNQTLANKDKQAGIEMVKKVMAREPKVAPEIEGIGKPKKTSPFKKTTVKRTVKEQFDDISTLLKKKIKSKKGEVGGELSPEQRAAVDRLRADAKEAGKDLGAFLKENVGLSPNDIKDVLKLSKISETPTVKTSPFSGLKKKVKHYDVTDASKELTTPEKAALSSYTKLKKGTLVPEHLNAGERAQRLLDISTGKLRKNTPWSKPLAVKNEAEYKLVDSLLKQRDVLQRKLVSKYGDEFKPKLSKEERSAWNKLDDSLQDANLSLEDKIRGKFISEKPAASTETKLAPDSEFEGLGVIRTEGAGVVPKKSIKTRAQKKIKARLEEVGVAGLGASETKAAPKIFKKRIRPSKSLGKNAVIKASGRTGRILEVDPTSGKYKVLIGKRAKWYGSDQITIPQGQTALSPNKLGELADRYAPTKGAADLRVKKNVARPEFEGTPGEQLKTLQQKLAVYKKELERARKLNDVKRIEFYKGLVKSINAKLSNLTDRILKDSQKNKPWWQNEIGSVRISKGAKKGKSLKSQMKELRSGSKIISRMLAKNPKSLKKGLLERGYSPVAIRAIVNEVRSSQIRQLNKLRNHAPEMLEALRGGTKKDLRGALKELNFDKEVIDKFMANLKIAEAGVDVETATIKKVKEISTKIKSKAPELQDRVDTLNAALEFAVEHPEHPMVKDALRPLAEQVVKAVANQEIPLENVGEILMAYDNPADAVKAFVKVFKEPASKAARLLNLHSQTSKIMNKLISDAGLEAELVYDIPEEGYPIWTAITKGVRKTERERLIFQTFQWGTAARNFWSQSGRTLTEMSDSLVTGMYRALGSKVTGIKVEGGALLPFKSLARAQALENEFALMRILNKATKGKVKLSKGAKLVKYLDDILEAFPLEKHRMIRTPIGSGGQMSQGPMDKLGYYGKFKKILNFANVTQEMHYRRQAFLAKLLEYSEKYGTEVTDMDFWKANPQFVEDSVTHALKLTFAENVQFPLAQAAFKFYRDVPFMTLLAHPYIRFYSNAVKFIVQHDATFALGQFAVNPKLVKSLVDPNVGVKAYEKLGMGTIGQVMMAAAAAVLGSKYAGSKWYTVKPHPDTEPNKEIDLRPFAPFVNYMFKAAVWNDFVRFIKGERTLLTGTDYLQGIAAINRVSGTGLVIVDILRGKAETIGGLISRYIGQILGGYSTWGRTYIDLLTGFDAESGKLRSTSEPLRITPEIDKWLQKPEHRGAFNVVAALSPFINNIPVANKRLQTFSRATEEGEAKTERPILKQLTGITTKKVTFLQQELNRLNYVPRPKYGHPTINRLVNAEAVKRISKSDILNTAYYNRKGVTDEDKIEILKAAFSKEYKRAYDKIKYNPKYKHLFPRDFKKKFRTQMNRKIGPLIFQKRKR